jgi:catechol 2,3-dioxygenase-like lactoylglutathione lyase family enzyme
VIIKRIEHVTVNVADIGRSVAFFRDIMGFRYLETVPDGPKDIVYFDIDGVSRLELFDFHGAAQKPAPVEGDADPLGYVHAAFLVDDVDEWVEHFRKNGVKITLEPCDLQHLGMRVCLFLDPDDNVFEVCAPIK